MVEDTKVRSAPTPFSPILANIYLDRLDKFVETELLPAYNRGKERKVNRTYRRLKGRLRYWKRKGLWREAKALRKELQAIPSMNTHDPDYRRLRYVRYADDFLLGFTGPRQETEEIKRRLGEFLRDTIKLDLSEEKTLITHARTEAAHFLGYEIVVINNDQRHDHQGRRTVNGVIGLRVPEEVVRKKCAPYQQHGEPTHRAERTNDAVFSIVANYQAEYRGIVEYYRLAYNLHKFNRLKYVMERSLTQTLARKLKTSVRRIHERFKAVIQTPEGVRRVLLVKVEREGKPPLVTWWGGITLKRKKSAVLDDQPRRIWNTRTELIERLLADTGELCGSQENVQVHHVRKLADLQKKEHAPKPRWIEVMVARKRKTLVICHKCHVDIHAGRLRRHEAP